MEKRKTPFWMRRVNKNLVSEILSLKPEDVYCTVEYPNLVKCIIVTKDGTGVGIALCSTTERFFDVTTGKTKALGRALKAIKKKGNSGVIRNSWLEFPGGWSKRQIDHVIECSRHVYKSRFVGI